MLTLSDWYHQQMRPLISRFLHVENPTGAEPVPDSALLNETRDLRVRLQPGKTYLFRIINIGGFANSYLWFEGHSMKIVEVDGVYTEQAEASMIYLTPAQRYAVLIKAKENADANFPFVASMDQVSRHIFGFLGYSKTDELRHRTSLTEFLLGSIRTYPDGLYTTNKKLFPHQL